MSRFDDPRTLGRAVVVLRWLSVEMRKSGSDLWLVPRDLADALVSGSPTGCRTCGDPVPRNRTGRPRLFCLVCSPRKTTRKALNGNDEAA